MSLPTSRLSYQDCLDLYDQALAAERGIRVKMPDIDYATFFRMRLHKARSIIREENKQIHERGHAMWGCSVFDPIAIKIRMEAGVCWLYLEKIDTIHMEIEPIEGVPQIEAPAQPLQIEHKQEVLPPIRRRV